MGYLNNLIEREMNKQCNVCHRLDLKEVQRFYPDTCSLFYINGGVRWRVSAYAQKIDLWHG